jgi:hypothetical protein
MAGQILAALRDGSWLTGGRAVGYMRMLAIANVLGLALAICRAHGWLLPQEPHFSTEFLSFYAAGRLADAGNAAGIYAPGMSAHAFTTSFNQAPAHIAMEQAVADDPKIDPFGFFYPPIFALLCAPLARLPYLAAHLTWVFITGASLAVLLWRITGTWRTILRAIAYLAVIENAGVGENAFLSASLIGFGLLSLERRPLVAGICFGALCYKPHFLLPIGIFLLAGRHWRTVAAAVITSAGLCIAAAIAFGWQIWLTYFTITVPHADYVFRHAGVAFNLQATPVSAILLLGGSNVLASAVQWVAILFAGWIIIAARGASLNIRAALLTASFPLMLPVMLDYDLTTTGLAILFLLREAAATSFRPYEKTALAAMFALPWITWIFRTDLNIPLDPLIPAAFMLIVAARLPGNRFGRSRVRQSPA